MTAQDAQHVQAWMRARQSIESYNTTLGKLDETQLKNAKATRDAEKAERELDQIRDRVLRGLRDSETAAAKYNRQLAMLNTLRQKNKLTEEQYAAAVKKTKAEAISTTGVGGLDKIAGRLTSIAAGYVSIQAGAQMWINSNRELLEQANQLGEKYDTMARKFRVQAGLNAVQGKDAQEKILDQAEIGGNTAEEASQVANAMASTGFEADQITGGGVREMLRIFNAQTVAGKGEDLSKMTEAMSRYLESQNLPKTAENARMIGEKIQGLKATPLKITDLEAFASEAAGLRGKMTIDEQFASFGQLIGIEEGGMSATDLRNIAGRLSTSGGDKSKKKALQRIGVKPTEVDLVGETFDQAVERINAGLQKIPEGERDSILKKLVDEKGVAPFKKFASGLDQRKQYIEEMNRPGLVDQDAQIIESGRAAADRRLTMQNEREKLRRDDMGDLRRKALQTELLSSGRSPLQTDVTLKTLDLVRYASGSKPNDNKPGNGFAAKAAAIAGDAATDWRTYTPIGGIWKALGIGGKSTRQATAESVGLAERAERGFQKSLGPEFNPPQKPPADQQPQKLIDALDRNTKATEAAATPQKQPSATIPRNQRLNTNQPARRPSEQLQGGQ